ncbi:PQQ-binding-like beta-propeller repeat protein [Achromobacter sp. GG226]|nr:PQQ-binding-like beta-propeller repeat protein [Verticiella sp. GG226]
MASNDTRSGTLMTRTVLSAALAACTLFAAGAHAQVKNYQPVTDQEVLAPKAEDWLMWRRTVDNQAYSPLEQINTGNVTNLRMAWSWTLPVGGLQEAAPLVRDGVMFLGLNLGVVQALDAKTGELIWEHRQKLPTFTGGYHDRQASRQRNNITLYRDKVYLTTPDSKLVALNAATGEVAWEHQVLDWEKGYSFTAGPLAADGKIFTGTSGCSIAGTAGGCFITAHDAESGKELWRLNTIGGPEVDDTWGGLAQENRWGGSPWITGAYDAERKTLYWGVGMPLPYPAILRGSGDGAALYTNSTLAIDAETGKVKWHYQHLPQDDWDLDSPFERVLVDSEIAPAKEDVSYLSSKVKSGQKYDVIVSVPGKYGTVFVLDRDSGELLWARDTAHQNVIKGFTADGKVQTNTELFQKAIDQTVTVCGGRDLGKLWMAGAYSPLTNAFYVPVSESCKELTPQVIEVRQGESVGAQASGKASFAPGEDTVGRVYAVDVKSGKLLWVQKQAAIFSSSVMTTGGGLVFTGDSMREFAAYDQKDGNKLWQVKLNTTVGGHPTTYSVDGKQYVAVVTGPNAQTPVAQTLSPELKNVVDGGHSLFVFALP